MSKLNWPDNFVYKLLYSAPSVKIDYDNEFEKMKKHDDYEASIMYVLYTLDKRSRDIIFKYYRDNMTLKAIGEEYHITGTGVRHIIAKSFYNIRRYKKDRLLEYGVKGWIDTCVKHKIGEESSKSINSFLMKEESDMLNMIEELYEHSKSFKHQTYMECYIFDKTLEELELSVRSYNGLLRAGIRNVKDILDKEDLIVKRKIRNIGKVHIEEIIDKMISIGFTDFGKSIRGN